MEGTVGCPRSSIKTSTGQTRWTTRGMAKTDSQTCWILVVGETAVSSLVLPAGLPLWATCLRQWRRHATANDDSQLRATAESHEGVVYVVHCYRNTIQSNWWWMAPERLAIRLTEELSASSQLKRARLACLAWFRVQLFSKYCRRRAYGIGSHT